MTVLRKIKIQSENNLDITSTEQGTKVALDTQNVDTPVWDRMEVTFPDNITDLFTYYIGPDVVMTVLVTYSTAAKSTIISMEKERFY